MTIAVGNFDGLGKTREKELTALWTRVLQQSTHTLDIRDHKSLQDGMRNDWDCDSIAEIVQEYIKAHEIQTVLTFDQNGVSNHPNHIATHFGVRRALEATRSVQGFALETTNLVRKYLGPLDLPLSSFGHCTTSLAPRINYNAMATHASQFVWYRRLFVIFSRYTFINSWKKL